MTYRLVRNERVASAFAQILQASVAFADLFLLSRRTR
jgi:hypothetical protein